MIIPKFWAEGRARERVGKKQVTIRRFGWSDLSQADAQLHADERALSAMVRALSGEKLPRREPKLAYNGADGVPIREEIVAQHGDTIITRNIYGALCLNTPDVLFADVDVPPLRRASFGCGYLIACAIATFATLASTRSIPFAGAVLGACLLLSIAMIGVTNFVRDRKRPKLEQSSRARVETVLRQFPDWRIALYRTPAGFRLLALHRLFKADEPAALAFFDALKADDAYVYMCRHQQCFRARVSPKPWRIGIPHHIKPRPGVWPINPERLPDRQQWIAAYNRASETFASCRYLDTFGTGTTNAKAATVKKLHDDLSRATTSFPIA
ncbi:MAG: hypothetical protein QM760_01540 [Nibricoccus sp.]